MSKLFSVLSLFILALVVLSLSAQEIDVTGDWELTSVFRGEERTQDVHFKQEGEKLTVTMTRPGPMGGEITAEGTVKGNEIEWSATMSTQRGEFTISYKGKIEGDTMSGEVRMGDRGPVEWKAKRK